MDDEPAIRGLIALALRRAGFDVLEAGTGEAALEMLSSQTVAVVVLDVAMPGMSGVEVVRELRLSPDTATLPIVMMTGSGGADSVIVGLEAGADDFLAKPVRLDELVARVRAHLRSHSAWSHIMEDELRARTGVVSALGKLAVSAVPEDMAATVVAELGQRTRNDFVAVLQLAGGARLQPLATFHTSAGVARGGPPIPASRARYLMSLAEQGPWSEAVIGPEPGEPSSPFWEAELDLAAGAPIYAGDQQVAILVLGRRLVPGAPPQVQRAKAMAEAIDYASVLSLVAGSSIADRRDADARRALLRQALASGGFHPVFQPIVLLDTEEVVGFEALTRFADGIAPDVRFADAGSLGLGHEYELVSIAAAIDGARRLPADAFLALNVTPNLILHSDHRLRRMLRDIPRAIVIELTEHAPVSDYPRLRAAIERLGNVRLAIDDAGAGYASLRHILELRPALVKLDISLVRGIDGDDLRQAAVTGLVYYALKARFGLIAEGVETRTEADTMRRLGLAFGQGYLFGRPE